MSFRVFTLLDLDDYASERARALSDDDMIMLKTLRFYHDQMSMQDPVPAGKWYWSDIEQTSYESILYYKIQMYVCVCLSVCLSLSAIGSHTMRTLLMKLLQTTQWV